MKKKEKDSSNNHKNDTPRFEQYSTLFEERFTTNNNEKFKGLDTNLKMKENMVQAPKGSKELEAFRSKTETSNIKGKENS